MYGYNEAPILAGNGGPGPSLWLAPLDITQAELGLLADGVPAGERAAANRLHRPVDRRRRLAARAWLRRILGGLLGCGADDVVLLRGEHRKPVLAGGGLNFSVSCSEGLALFATSWDMEVGVDLQAGGVGTRRDLDAVASRFFTAPELDAIASASEADRASAVLQCWTCKEAYGKALGVGLDFPLREVATWRADGRPVDRGRWSVHQIAVGGGFHAALAGSGPPGWAPRPPRQLTLDCTEGASNDQQ
ncbi:MAG TPA: 4'-phosphopantetheinyl transferase superfamily protein [Solirubrobacteraceae bacterium]